MELHRVAEKKTNERNAFEKMTHRQNWCWSEKKETQSDAENPPNESTHTFENDIVNLCSNSLFKLIYLSIVRILGGEYSPTA